jgi:hypothetical protein
MKFMQSNNNLSNCKHCWKNIFWNKPLNLTLQ